MKFIRVIVLLCIAVPARGQQHRVEWPQVKINQVHALDPADWDLSVTALDASGKAMDLSAQTISVFLGRERVDTTGAPLTRFEGDLPQKGFRGRLKPIRKSDRTQAVVIVIAVHSDVTPEVREALPGAVATLLKGLKKDAKVSVLVYGDVLQVLWSPDGTRGDWRDLDDYQNCLGRLRDEADSAPPAGPELPCGRLANSPEVVAGFVTAIPPGQGLFPRLLGVPESAEVVEMARQRGHARLERRHGTGVTEPFAIGAVEAALRLLMIGSDPGSERLILLLSDGEDGYLRISDLASRRISETPACREVAQACEARMAKRARSASLDHEGGSQECTREVLECTVPRLTQAMRRREEVVRDALTALVQRLRAAGVRVHAIALPQTRTLGTRRLEALSFKTGGTFRAARSLVDLDKGSVLALADELASEVVIRPAARLDAETDYVIAVSLDQGDRLVSAPYRFHTGRRVWFFEAPIHRGRAFLIAKLGHRFGPPVFWVALVVGGLAVLFLTWKLGKGIVALVKGLGKKAPKPAAPIPVKAPTLKRPGK